MENALIVSSVKKNTAFFTELLNAASILQVTVLNSCGEAKRLLLERSFDLVIVDAPLRDESGESLSRYAASRGESQVILVVKNEHFEAISAACEDDGVLTIAKPMNRAVFWSVLSLAKSALNRIKRVEADNQKLKQQIDDIRTIDRAKWILISHSGMSEQEAHRFMEKQAMDTRSTKRSIAEKILKLDKN